MEEDEDDLYGSNQIGQPAGPTSEVQWHGGAQIKNEELEDEEEEGEEIEEDSDSDIDIITERKPATKSEPLVQNSRQEAIKTEPNRAPSIEQPKSRVQPPAIKSETPNRIAPPQKLGSQYPEVRTSTIDVNAVPTYEPADKPITALDFDADLAEHDKPWRRPGVDQSDYFNYGFDEFTWATYCLKQKTMRESINAQKAESAKFEMMFGGAPGMAGMGMPGSGPPVGGGPQSNQPQQQPGAGVQPQPMDQPMGGMSAMPGMPEMSPEMMNAMMQQMMQSGVDPSQMDFGTFMQQMQQMQGGGAPTGMSQPGGFGAQGPGGYNGGGGGGGDVGGGGGRGGGGGGGGRKGRRW